MTAPRPAPKRPGAPTGMVAIVIAAAVLVAAPLTADREGLRTRPYLDPANIPTVCYGETMLEMRIYSRDECGKMLRERMAADYAPAILKCVPGFIDPKRRNAFAASIDAAYNAGPDAFCRSRMARAFNAGRWTEGCNGFAGWYVTARVYGKPVMFKGLVSRRLAERALCLKPVAVPGLAVASVAASVVPVAPAGATIVIPADLAARAKFAGNDPALIDGLAYVNRIVNQAIEPVSDEQHYGGGDKMVSWPEGGKGDCEDYALSKLTALGRSGVPIIYVARLRLVMMHVRPASPASRAEAYGHAILEVLLPGGEIAIMDNRFPGLMTRAELEARGYEFFDW